MIYLTLCDITWIGLMYIWVVLATFIVSLAAFNLSVRSDMRELYVAPQAEATLTKIYLQQEAARVFAISQAAQQGGMYTHGEVQVSDIQEFLPIGFQLGDDAADLTKQNFSYVYCLSTDTDNLANKAAQCSGDDYQPYLVTYGCIPQRWKNVKDGRPRNELITAMYNMFGSGGHLGYTVALDPTKSEQNVMGSSMGINVRDVKWAAIPQYIISEDDGAHSFYNVCGDNKACDYCLMSMSVLPIRLQEAGSGGD